MSKFEIMAGLRRLLVECNDHQGRLVLIAALQRIENEGRGL